MTPPTLPQIAIKVSVDWTNGVVTFSEIGMNGLAIVNPPTINVPVILVMRIAAEAIQRSLPPQYQQLNVTGPPQRSIGRRG